MINLAYDVRGNGDPVLCIAGRGGAGRTWHLHQVPALQRAGFRAITFDNRGTGATENASGFDTQTMLADIATLIDEVAGGPVRVVAVSMGAYLAQELMLAHPDLVSQAVLMATRGRQDRTREFGVTAELALLDAGITLPPAYDAKVRLLENFSPATLNDDRLVADWIDMFTMWPRTATPGARAQLQVGPVGNRLPAYRAISAEVLVLGFADDVLIPPHLGREVADAIPAGRYLEIPDTGHLGFVERPDAVNAEILKFFGRLPL